MYWIKRILTFFVRDKGQWLLRLKAIGMWYRRKLGKTPKEVIVLPIVGFRGCRIIDE